MTNFFIKFVFVCLRTLAEIIMQRDIKYFILMNYLSSSFFGVFLSINIFESEIFSVTCE